jgi:hypothetical protein
MRPRHVAVVGLLTLFVAAAPAAANLPASIEVPVAPGGNASVSSPTLPATMRSATVDIAPADADSSALIRDLGVVLSLQPTPGRRLLMCIGLYVTVAHAVEGAEILDFSQPVHPLASLMLSACLEQAAQIDRAMKQRQAGAAARGACPRVATQVPATFTRVGGKYRATIDGPVSRLSRRGRLKVTCRRRGAGLTLKVRPAARGRSLRSVVGPRLRLGLYNPLDADGAAPTRVTFRP